MGPKQFLALALLAATTLVAAITTYAVNSPWSRIASGGVKLVPDLTSDARVAKIEVAQADKKLTLERRGDGWSIAERSGHPANVDKVRALLRGLANAEMLEPKTGKPERHSLLEVEDPASKEAKSRVVRLTSEAGRSIGEVVVGKKRYDAFGSGKSGTYVRRGGEAQAWLANADLDPSILITDWVTPDVLQLETGTISRLVVEMPGEEPLTVERAADNKSGPLQIVGLPEEKKLKDASVADGIARAASSLALEDVRAVTRGGDSASAGTVRVQTVDGLTAVLRVRKDGDAYWVSVQASGSEAAKVAADGINSRTSGWEYRVPAAKAEGMLRRRADLFQQAS